MEIIVIISLVLLALGAFFIIPKSQKKGKAKETNSGANGMTSSSYTKEEISKHNTRKDCWIIIKDKVYDVTPYVEEHPGGDAILNNAGVIPQRAFSAHNTARGSLISLRISALAN